MKKLVLYFCLVYITCCGQQEASKWYFGNRAALDFQNGSPVSVPTSSSMVSQFSSSTIADSLGNLLFYVRGADLIYNRNHDTMAFGIGGPGTSQSGVILKKSGSKYYVITHNIFNGTSSPINPMWNYSIVDMSLAGGLGAVTVSNVPVSPPGVRMVGKSAATNHCNETDHWFLLHNDDTGPGARSYYAYLVTNSSVSTNPVISNIGSDQIKSIPGFYRGFHKFSPNGRKICATMPYQSVEIFDFDRATGVVSNFLKIDSTSNPVPNYTNTPHATGIEFSPDGTKLYVAYLFNHPFLCQFDLCAGNSAAVIASKTVISFDTIGVSSTGFVDLQLAIDGKIYIAGTSSVALSVINNPNAAGISCNYTPNAVALGTIVAPPYYASAYTSLTQFSSEYFEQKPSIPAISGSVNCGSASFNAPQLCAGAGYSVTGYKWKFGDPLTGAADSSALANPTHVFSANGTYTVKLVLQYPCGADTLRMPVNISGLPNFSITGKTTICKGEKTTISLNGADSYSLNGTATGQGNVVIQPTTSTVYTFSATDNLSGCRSSTSLKVTVLPCTDLKETTIPSGNILVFPNPAKGVFNLLVSQQADAVVIDVNGKVIWKTQIEPGESTVDLGDTAQGVYFLKLRFENSTEVIKLLKQ